MLKCELWEGEIKTLAVLTQTFDNESYEATESKPFAILYFNISFQKDKYVNTHKNWVIHANCVCKNKKKEYSL